MSQEILAAYAQQRNNNDDNFQADVDENENESKIPNNDDESNGDEDDDNESKHDSDQDNISDIFEEDRPSDTSEEAITNANDGETVDDDFNGRVIADIPISPDGNLADKIHRSDDHNNDDDHNKHLEEERRPRLKELQRRQLQQQQDQERLQQEQRERDRERLRRNNEDRERLRETPIDANENDITSPVHIGGQIFIPSLSYTEAFREYRPSKFITIMSHAIWRYENLTLRAVKVGRRNRNKLPLTPTKKVALERQYAKLLQKRNLSAEMQTVERNKINTYLGRSISSAEKKIANSQ